MVRKAYSAEDPDDIRKASEAEDSALAAIMRTYAGRRWLYHLIHTTCHVDLPSHVPGDPMTTAFNEGGRSVGINVRAEAMTSPNYLKMLEENHDGRGNGD